MSLRLEKYLILFLTLSICGGILAWSFFLNFGKVSFTSNHPFTVSGLGKQLLTCPAPPCQFKVQSGLFNAVFQAKGQQEIQAIIEVKRFQTTDFALNFTFQPILQKISKPLERLPRLPQDLEQMIAPTWDQNKTQVAYFKNQKSLWELFLWDIINRKNQKITNFYRLSLPRLTWGQTQKFLLVQDQAQLFLINLAQSGKQKLKINGEDLQLQFSPQDDLLLLAQDDKLMIYTFKNQTIQNLPFFVPLEQIFWAEPNHLIYVEKQEKQTVFKNYDLADKTASILLTAEELQPQNWRLSTDKKSVLFQSQKQNYALQFKE